VIREICARGARTAAEPRCRQYRGTANARVDKKNQARCRDSYEYSMHTRKSGINAAVEREEVRCSPLFRNEAREKERERERDSERAREREGSDEKGVAGTGQLRVRASSETRRPSSRSNTNGRERERGGREKGRTRERESERGVECAAEAAR